MSSEALAPSASFPAQRSSDRAEPDSASSVDAVPTTGATLIEQAKGVLVHCYAIDADRASDVLDLWAAQAVVDHVTLAYALVHDVCQAEPARRPSDPALVRWLEEQLRADCPDVERTVRRATHPVSVVVDQSYSSLEDVVAAAREAGRAGVPLEITFAATEAGLPRAHLMQRIDLAVDLARAVAPGLVVRLEARAPVA
jgi:hypothetical protein